MRFKTDENIHPDVANLLRAAGHDAVTVWDQGMEGGSDLDLAAVCRHERRAIVTFDLGFADSRAYPPSLYAGLIVLRLRSQSRSSVMSVVRRLLSRLTKEELSGRLWIVHDASLRIRECE